MSSAPETPRAAVDSNLFVSRLLQRQGQPFALLQALRARRFTLVISEEQRAELQDVFSRPRLIQRYQLSVTEAADLLALIDRVGQRVPGAASVPVAVRDTKDAMILASAVSGGAGYLVTGDDDLLVVDGHPALGTLRIVTVRDFLQVLAETRGEPT